MRKTTSLGRNVDQFDRVYQLDRIFQHHRYPVTMNHLTDELECSKSSVKRALESLRLYYNAPVRYRRQPNGYYYDLKADDTPFELPGMWFSAAEIHALFVIDHFLNAIDPGLLKEALIPFERRINNLMRRASIASDNDYQRIKIIAITHRQSEPKAFRKVADALLQNKQLHLNYHARASDLTTERTVSPQRLIHYRDNWYLDVWCHKKNALRTFALDRISKAKALEVEAYRHEEPALERHFASSFGIFSGEASQTAVLKFSPKQARWVADEQWHPEQVSRTLENGSYELQLPYHNPQELIMEILKHGPEVEVLNPSELRQAIRERLQQTLAQYQKT